MCHVLVQEMKHSTIANARTLEETGNSLHDYEAKVAPADGLQGILPEYERSMKEEEKTNIDDVSVHSVMPVLYYFPFCWNHTVSRSLFVV